jgi:tRNA (cytidine/uridine-2'-O-)-methyltransferase
MTESYQRSSGTLGRFFGPSEVPGTCWRNVYSGVLSAEASLHVVLVEPEIHWNTGNAGRTCLAVGARLHLVRPLGFSLGERQIRRAGLDYWPRVDPVVWDRWADFEAGLPSLGEPFFFSAEGERDLWSVDFPPSPGRTALIFGKESAGLAPEIRRRYADRLVRIPMVDPEIRSLNLSTAVALAAYEVARQRRG